MSRINTILLAMAIGLSVAACSDQSSASDTREALVCNGEVRLTREIGEVSGYDSKSRSFVIMRRWTTVGIYTVKVGEPCRFVPVGRTAL